MRRGSNRTTPALDRVAQEGEHGENEKDEEEQFGGDGSPRQKAEAEQRGEQGEHEEGHGAAQHGQAPLEKEEGSSPPSPEGAGDNAHSRSCRMRTRNRDGAKIVSDFDPAA